MTEPIRVMHVVLSLELGGLERIVDDLVRRADPSEITPSVCCVEAPGHLAEGLRNIGVEVVSLDKGPGLRLKGFWGALRAFKRVRPHVVHTHQIGALFYAGPAARLAGVPVVVHTEHGKHFEESRRLRILGRLGARHADRVFTVSDDIARDAFRLKVFSPRRTRTVINGIDVERFSRPADVTGLRKTLRLAEDNFVVGTVARLSPVKDQGTLIEAFGLLLKRKPGTHLGLVGDGACRAELEAQARSAGLDAYVHFAGAQDDVVPYFKLFDVFALSSLSEGIPLSILEAMAAGVPVVSTAVGGVGEIVSDGKTGVLVAPGQPETLATALANLAGNPARRSELAAAARKMVEREYSLARMARTYLDEYRKLLELRGALPVASREAAP